MAIPWSPYSWGAAPLCWPRRRRGWLCGCWHWPSCRPALWRRRRRRSGCPSSSAGRVAAGGASLYSPPHWCSRPFRERGKSLSVKPAWDFFWWLIGFFSTMKTLSVLCIHAESCWSSGTLCSSLWISAQLISGFPHYWKENTGKCSFLRNTHTTSNIHLSMTYHIQKVMLTFKRSMQYVFKHKYDVRQSFTWGILACASCSHSCRRWSAGGGWPVWLACCLGQERSPSGGSDGPRQTEWVWQEDPPPGTKR